MSSSEHHHDLDSPGAVAIPARLQTRRHNGRGVPIPYFVALVDGKPDFRFVDREKMVSAVRKRLCFLCGEKLGQHLAFVVGPMCTVNRISAEPPAHRECAEYAVQACPFMLDPTRERRPPDPGTFVEPAGHMIQRNPGVMAVWITGGMRLVKATGGVLFGIGEPTEVTWYTRGRLATRQEVMDAMDAGLPALAADAMRTLRSEVARAHTLLPAAV